MRRLLLSMCTAGMLIAATVSPTAGGDAPAGDSGWPRSYTTPSGGRVQIYQPQIASWEGQKRLAAYVAVAYHALGASTPALGTLKVEADTTVAVEERLVSFAALKIVETSFGSLGYDAVREIVAEIERAMPEFERVIDLDRVLANLDVTQILPGNVEGVKADPPAIFFSTKPAVLVNFDGEPIWSPIPGNDLKFAVNTNWDVFEHTRSHTLYLRNGYVWLKANALAGPWVPAGTLPDSLAKLPADENWTDVRTSLPGRAITPTEIPAVFVSTAPAELIVVRGAASYLLVSNSSRLLWVNNTDSDVFRLGKSGLVYYLVAGRWFSAPDFTGPWTFATPTLPPDFKAIGVDHPRARVLASVPGTRQAAEAVALAQIPQTARVDRAALQAPEVRYQGEPQFQPIERTSLHRAVNTDKDIIKVGDLYYLCFQGVWFVTPTPNGPWQVAHSVPTQVYSIPASSPVYHLTYVSVVEYDADWVVFSSGAGYTGVTIAWGCAVWGTGWYYPPYVWYGGYYPVYFPHYPTYGYSAWYHPASGTYGRGAVAYGPYGGLGATARYNPATGTYARGAVAWGPYGAGGATQAYNPRTGAYGQTRQGTNVYGSWGSTYVQRGDEWARTARVSSDVTGNTARVTRTNEGAMVSRSGPGGGFVTVGEDGMYAGRDGNVYRRAEEGGWQKYENGEWGATQRPDSAMAPESASAGTPPDRSTIGHLERDRSARIDGAQRTRERPAASARPSGTRRGGPRR